MTQHADPWQRAKAVIGSERVTLGPQASQQWLHQPDHLAFVLARYRAAAALIGGAEAVLEVGCGEGIGAGILATGREWYCGVDSDAEAVGVAISTQASATRLFLEADVLTWRGWAGPYDAVVSLDTIEHIPADREDDFMATCRAAIGTDAPCVIGTPNARFLDLASPQSKAGHVNNYDHARLHALMSKHFRVVQSFGMNDVALHLGHPEARHYLIMCGIGPR